MHATRPCLRNWMLLRDVCFEMRPSGISLMVGFALMLTSGCDRSEQETKPFSKVGEEFPRSISEMMTGEILVVRAVDWVSEDPDLAVRGRSDQSIFQAAALCSTTYIWEPTSHLSAILIPSENSPIWSGGKRPDWYSDEEIIDCIGDGSNEDFFVYRARNASESCCGTILPRAD